MATATFRIWRGDKTGGEFKDYTAEIGEGMVVLDCVHQIQADAGRRPRLPLELQGRQVRLLLGRDQRQAPAHVHDAAWTPCPPISRSSSSRCKTFPLIKDLVTDVSWNYKVNKMIPPFKPRRRRRTAPGACGRRKSTASRSSASASSASCARTFATCSAITTRRERRVSVRSRMFGGPRFMIRVASLEMHPLDTEDRLPLLKDKLNIGLCNITKCCTEVCPEHIHITDNAIIPLKERVVDRFYDPVMWLCEVLSGEGEAKRTTLKELPVCGG